MSLKRFINGFLYPRIINHGNGNEINIAKTAYFRKTRFQIYGNNNKVFIDENVYMHNAHIRIGFSDCPVNNCILKIGKNTAFNSLDMQLGEEGSIVEIGDNSMFSFHVEICCTDTHAILDNEGNLLNRGESIKIGSHVWVCKNVVITKNTEIPDNCIVAQGSIVTKKFSDKNCVIAGVPARVVKKDINWDAKRPQKFIVT